MTRTVDMDVLRDLSEMINHELTVDQICAKKRWTRNALYDRLKNHAEYLVHHLPQAKFNKLMGMYKADRTNNDIAKLLGLPLTLVNHAGKLFDAGHFS